MFLKDLVEQYYTLWTQDYWRDELFTIFLSQKSYYEIIVLTAKDFNPPLFYFLTKIVINLFGYSTFYLRQIPLAFHILSAVVAYKFARLFFSKLSAVIYSFLILSNPFLLFYAFELRPYSAIVFLGLLSCYFYFSKNKIGFIVASVIGLYTHTYYLIFYGMFFVYQAKNILYKHKEQVLFIKVSDLFTQLKPLILKPYLVLPLIMYLPWIPVLILQTISKSKGFWLEKSGIHEIFTSIATYLAGLNYIPLYLSIFIIVIYLVIILFWANFIKPKVLYISFVFGIVPIVMSVLVSLFTPIFTVRYLIFVVPFLFLFFTGILDGLQKAAKIICICLLVVISSIYLYVDYYAFVNPTNYRYGYLAYTVLNNTAEKPVQIITTEPIHFFGIRYYFEREGIKRENIKFFNLDKTFPHFIGDVVLEESEIINRYPNNVGYIYLGKESF